MTRAALEAAIQMTRELLRKRMTRELLRKRMMRRRKLTEARAHKAEAWRAQRILGQLRLSAVGTKGRLLWMWWKGQQRPLVWRVVSGMRLVVVKQATQWGVLWVVGCVLPLLVRLPLLMSL
jgi:hypothetical protein